MVGDECPTKVKKPLKEELDELKFVMRAKSISQVIENLFLFYKSHKPEYRKWKTETNKKR